MLSPNHDPPLNTCKWWNITFLVVFYSIINVLGAGWGHGTNGLEYGMGMGQNWTKPEFKICAHFLIWTNRWMCVCLLRRVISYHIWLRFTKIQRSHISTLWFYILAWVVGVPVSQHSGSRLATTLVVTISFCFSPPHPFLLRCLLFS